MVVRELSTSAAPDLTEILLRPERLRHGQCTSSTNLSPCLVFFPAFVIVRLRRSGQYWSSSAHHQRVGAFGVSTRQRQRTRFFFVDRVPPAPCARSDGTLGAVCHGDAGGIYNVPAFHVYMTPHPAPSAREQKTALTDCAIFAFLALPINRYKYVTHDLYKTKTKQAGNTAQTVVLHITV